MPEKDECLIRQGRGAWPWRTRRSSCTGGDGMFHALKSMPQRRWTFWATALAKTMWRSNRSSALGPKLERGTAALRSRKARALLMQWLRGVLDLAIPSFIPCETSPVHQLRSPGAERCVANGGVIETLVPER